MLRGLQDKICPSKSHSLAGAFIRLGWVGFWLQVVFGSIPLFGMAYYFIFSGSGTTSRFRDAVSGPPRMCSDNLLATGSLHQSRGNSSRFAEQFSAMFLVFPTIGRAVRGLSAVPRRVLRRVSSTGPPNLRTAVEPP